MSKALMSLLAEQRDMSSPDWKPHAKWRPEAAATENGMNSVLPSKAITNTNIAPAAEENQTDDSGDVEVASQEQLAASKTTDDASLNERTLALPPSSVSEAHTNILQSDMDQYRSYCLSNNTTIVMRPVSKNVPLLNANLSEEGSTFRGKSVSLAPSCYQHAPLAGLIPADAALGEAYERCPEILDKSQKAYSKLMDKYQKDYGLAVDAAAKSDVGPKFLPLLNNAQFLGTVEATWRGLPVYYCLENGRARTEKRDGVSIPIFFILCTWTDGNSPARSFHRFSVDRQGIASEPVPEDSHLIPGMKPVHVLTHRTFTLDSVWFRPEEDDPPSLVGPDYDGLAYSGTCRASSSLQDHECWATQLSKQIFSPTMGFIVPGLDEPHVEEMRELTSWRHNHGYESANTCFTQELPPGAYTAFGRNGEVETLRDFAHVVEFYGRCWSEGVPLPLNANWKVGIDSRSRLPRVLSSGSGMSRPLVSPEELHSTAHHRELGVAFFQVRSWQLMPPRSTVFREEGYDGSFGSSTRYVWDPEFESFRAEHVAKATQRFNIQVELFNAACPGDETFVKFLSAVLQC